MYTAALQGICGSDFNNNSRMREYIEKKTVYLGDLLRQLLL